MILKSKELRLVIWGFGAWFFACNPIDGNIHAVNDEHDRHGHHSERNRQTKHPLEEARHVAHSSPENHEPHATAHVSHAHEHGHNELSDLDRPISELFLDTCEHHIKTHECDECRYEVGVVKAESKLFEDGLLDTVTPTKRIVAKPLRLTGEIRFDERRVAHVSAQVDGVIRKVHVTLGDKVKQGDSLFELDSVEIGQAKAAHQEALAMENLAQRNRDRLAALHADGIASEKEILHAEQTLDAARIRTGAARGMLERLGMRRVRATGASGAILSGKLVIRAPADGTILGMHAVTGEVIQSNKSLVTIGDNTALWVWADLYERDFAEVVKEHSKSALHAAIRVKAFPNDSFEGRLDFISPAMSETSRTIKIRIAVPNPDGKLLSGMFAEVVLFLAGDTQVPSLPEDAVLQDEGRAFVFVHHNGDYYVRRSVTRGNVFQDWVEIKEGLNGDETVVANGAFLLKSDVLRAKMGAGCAD